MTSDAAAPHEDVTEPARWRAPARHSTGGRPRRVPSRPRGPRLHREGDVPATGEARAGSRARAGSPQVDPTVTRPDPASVAAGARLEAPTARRQGRAARRASAEARRRRVPTARSPAGTGPAPAGRRRRQRTGPQRVPCRDSERCDDDQASGQHDGDGAQRERDLERCWYRGSCRAAGRWRSGAATGRAAAVDGRADGRGCGRSSSAGTPWRALTWSGQPARARGVRAGAVRSSGGDRLDFWCDRSVPVDFARHPPDQGPVGPAPTSTRTGSISAAVRASAPRGRSRSGRRHGARGADQLVGADNRDAGPRDGSAFDACTSRCAPEGRAMAVVTMRQLLESGVHFGHQTRRWNPKMKRFIFTERNGIYIVDLQQSLSYIDNAYDFVEPDRRPRRHHPVRRHQEAGAGAGRRPGRARRHAVRQPALARWHAHQLQHRAQASPAPQGARADRLRRRGGLEPHEEGAARPAPREGQAREDARRHPRHGQGPLGRVDRRHEQGAPRRQRGAQARHPGRRDPRHQLRPRRRRLPDPGQRRRDPRRRSC